MLLLINIYWSSRFVFSPQTLYPVVMGSEVPKEKMDEALEELKQSLDVVEENFLQNRLFILGDKISVADLVAIAEIMQVRMQLTANAAAAGLRIVHTFGEGEWNVPVIVLGCGPKRPRPFRGARLRLFDSLCYGPRFQNKMS